MLIQSAIAKSFAKAAHTYDQHAVLQKEVAQRLFERLKDIQIPSGQVLDVGAGTGYLTQLVKKHYPQVKIIALDNAYPMLAQAALKEENQCKSHCLCADAQQLPLEDNSIDIIISNLMLHWSEDIFSIFSEFRRVIRTNGVLLFSTLGPLTLNELRDSWAHVDQAAHVNAFMDMHHIGDALLKNHFKNPVVDMELLTLNYRYVHDLMRDLKGIGAHNQNIKRVQSLTGKGQMNAMLTAYENYRQSNGKLPATYEVIYGVAWKKERSNQFISSTGEVNISVKSILRREQIT